LRSRAIEDARDHGREERIELTGGARELKLLIAGGGTGGHVFPALAVAREWLERDKAREVVFVGTERGLEARLVPPAGLPLEIIHSAGLKGMSGTRLLRNLMLVGLALWDSAAILRRHHFAAAFGVGGYAAGPVMLAAAMQHVPSVIFEPNAEAGFTNRVLADMADRIAAGYPSVAERLGSRAVVTGCPVRSEFFSCAPPRPAPPYRILITGGSQGSRAINRAAMDAAEFLSLENKRLRIVHQSGERDYTAVRDAYARHGIDAEVAPFFENMAERFAQADLIVCRSGAITVAEVAAAGRAALFIPFGAATDSHQLRNAQEMVRVGAGRLLPEAELSGARLSREILGLLDNPETLVEFGWRARQMARPNAARQIVDLIEQVARA
jgi:UDP-N-acetylglucosamine--N-acetylmuramyl-(pentapeptide) pyrophosphoryl-undecaprenol N-acetylglucosamine transferase